MNWFAIFINSSVKGYMFQLFSTSKLQGEYFGAESPACFTSLDPKGLTNELRTTEWSNEPPRCSGTLG